MVVERPSRTETAGARRPRIPSARDFVDLVARNRGTAFEGAARQLVDWVTGVSSLKAETGASSYNVKLAHPRKDLSLFFVNADGAIVFGGWLKEQQIHRLDLPAELADGFYRDVAGAYGLRQDPTGAPLGLTIAAYAEKPVGLQDAVTRFAAAVYEQAPP